MSPLVAYHATRKCCRDSIRRDGLIGNKPSVLQPHGVYVFGAFKHYLTQVLRGGARVYWYAHPRMDVWRVEYIGPIVPDRYVTNGLVLLENVDPQHVSLVTGDNR